jgi:GMP synthase (glutamine-hydrolysing)
LLAHSLSSHLKLIGVCFGHQIISKRFGAKVEKVGRVGGIERIVFEDSIIKKYPFFEAIFGIPEVFLSEHHEDFVVTVPEGFKLIASSKSCELESFISNDARILTVQFHCEYFCHFTKRYEKRILACSGSNSLVKFYVP